MSGSLPRKGEEQGDLATSKLHQKIVLSSRRRRQAAVESRSTLHTPRKRVLNAVIWTRRTAKGMSFNVTCGHRGDADQIAAQTIRADIMIEGSLFTRQKRPSRKYCSKITKPDWSIGMPHPQTQFGMRRS